MRVFVVMPVYNEGHDTIRTLVEDVERYVPVNDIVLVDDGSTLPLNRDAVGSAKLLRHRVNLGKGMALKTGCEYAVSHGADVVVLMDGDGQHEPREIPRLIAALGDVDIAYAARELDRQMPVVRLAGNWTLNRCARWLFGLDLRDIWCGYRAFRAGVYDAIAWDAHDYAVDVEMAVRASLRGLTYRELPIGTVYHDAHKGVTVVDGLRLLGRLLRWKITL